MVHKISEISQSPKTLCTNPFRDLWTQAKIHAVDQGYRMEIKPKART